VGQSESSFPRSIHKEDQKMRSLTLVSLLILALLVAACGGGGEATTAPGGGTTGDPAAGQQVFTTDAQPPCNGCHPVEGDAQGVGPSLANIGTEAATINPPQTAEEYIRESIVNPDAFIVPDFPAGVMPKTYGEQLSEQQLNDLVAYLLSLK
jgi:mono/diheme cytochrome c family protein